MDITLQNKKNKENTFINDFFLVFFESLSKWMTGSSHGLQLRQILIIVSQPKKKKKILIISICGPKFEISTQKKVFTLKNFAT